MGDRKQRVIQLLAAGAIAMLMAPVAGAAELAKYQFSANAVAAERIKSVHTDTSTSASSFVGSAALGADATVASATDYVVFADGTGSSFDATRYIGFIMSINAPLGVDLTSLTFTQQAGIGSASSSTSLTVWSDVRSSLDNFQSSLLLTDVTKGPGSGSASKTPAPSIDLSAYKGVTGSVEFRFFVYDSTDSTADVQRFDNIIVNGAAVPEPTSAAAVAILGMSLLARRRRVR